MNASVFNTFFWLLLAFQAKHFLCDFPLQKHKSNKGSLVFCKWYPDLAEHCLVHMLGTFLVCLPAAGWRFSLTLATLDFLLHFATDRVKAHPRLGGRWTPADKLFWVALGADQMVHHVVNIFLACVAAFEAGQAVP